jgi:urease accessory protein UreF
MAMPAGLVTTSDAQAQAGAWQEAPVLQRNAVELIVAQNAVTAAKSPRLSQKQSFRRGVKLADPRWGEH